MRHFIRLIVSTTTLAIASPTIHAQIITDGSFGSILTLSGRDLEIGQELGTRAGNNLFHSFETFNIGPGGVVTFTGDSDINNVISRVTGGEVSNIDGILRSEVGNANFFFVNPAGVTFGVGGSVDVPASFHLSTAEQLVFTDGTTMDTGNPTTNTLTIAAPEEFGFLGNGSGKIDISGATMDITGGELNVTGSELVINNARLSSIGGGDIEIDIQGQVSLENGGQIITQSTGDFDAGNIELTAKQLNIDGQQDASFTGISTATFDSLTSDTGDTGDAGDAGDAGDIVLDVETMFISNGGTIVNNTFGAGDAGRIEVTTGQLLIDGLQSANFTGISSFTTNPTVTGEAAGDAGTIVLNSGEVEIRNGGSIESVTSGAGNAGRIELTTEQLFINRQGSELFTGIRSDENPESNGGANAVDVTVSGVATIANGGLIRSGDIVRITASQLVIDGQASQWETGIQTDSPEGSSAGIIDVHIFDTARIENGGRVSSSGSGIVFGGVIFNTRNLVIDGPGSGIFSETLSEDDGNGATIDVTVSELARIQNGGVISSGFRSLNPEGVFNGGDVQVTANRLFVDGQGSGIFTGNENVNGGRVAVYINEHAVIQNEGTISSEGGGSVSIESAQGFIELADGATITSAAKTGGFGSVTITTGGTITISNARVTTESGGGDEISPSLISLTAGTVDISHAEITTEASARDAEAGSIQIQSDVLIMEEGFIQANATSGRGGTITVTSDVVIPFANQLNTESTARLRANSGLGNVIQAVAEDGLTVSPTVNAPDTDISAGLAELNAEPANTAEIASNPCASFSVGAPSSLVEAGRGTLPTENYQQIYQQIELSKHAATTQDAEHRNTDRLITDASVHANRGCQHKL